MRTRKPTARELKIRAIKKEMGRKGYKMVLNQRQAYSYGFSMGFDCKHEKCMKKKCVISFYHWLRGSKRALITVCVACGHKSMRRVWDVKNKVFVEGERHG